MTGTYDIFYDGTEVGRARVERQGLYYRFSCRCRLEPGRMLRLMVSSGGKTVDLGVCVPMDGHFGVEKKLPCKEFCGGEPEFRVHDGKSREVLRDEKREALFHPVYPEEPFAHIARLKDAYLAAKNDQLGIVFRD